MKLQKPLKDHGLIVIVNPNIPIQNITAGGDTAVNKFFTFIFTSLLLLTMNNKIQYSSFGGGQKNQSNIEVFMCPCVLDQYRIKLNSVSW